MICENCETEIMDERDSYEIPEYQMNWCEDCMMRYMEGPQDDLLDDLAEDMARL